MTNVGRQDLSSDRPGGVAVVIVNYRTADLALACLAALAAERAGTPGLEAIVVDGGSQDGSAEVLRAGMTAAAFSGWATLLPLDFNGGFGWANNQAMLRLMQQADPPEFIQLLNPDAIVKPGAVARLVELLRQRPRAAAAGSQLLEPDGRPTGSAFRFPTIAREFMRGANTPALGKLLGIAPVLVELARPGQVDWVTGASVMLRTAALRETGLFDDGFFLYFEEVELMHRLRRAGWEIWHVPDSRVFHIGGAATGVSGPAQLEKPLPSYWHESRRRFFARTHGAAAARAAGVAWLAGNTIWRLRNLLGPARRGGEAPGERRDLLRLGVGAIGNDVTAAIVRADAPPGERPAWTRW